MTLTTPLVLTGKLPSLLLLAPAMLVAQVTDVPVPPKRGTSISSLLPPGSLLTGVMLPRYDENRRLLGVLRAQSVTLVNSDIFDGKTISIELFNPDHSPRGRMDMIRARYDQGQGNIVAKDRVTMSLDGISAWGNGLICNVDQAEGFLMGPASTRIKQPPPTTVNSSASPLRSPALVSASLLLLPLAMAPGAEDSAVPRQDVAETSQTVSEADAKTRSELRGVLNASAEATRAASAFLEKQELLAKEAPAAPQPVLEAMPLNVKPGPDDTVINCDGGMYFDAHKGLLVYLKNVTVADPRFTLDGANEVKVFFEQKPGEPLPKPKPNAKPVPGGMNIKIGEVERVVATGAVHLLKKPDEKNEAIEAAGAIFTYNFKTGEIILDGGKPWVKKGGMVTRAKKSAQTIRIMEGKFTFSAGGTESILPIDNIKQKGK